MNDANKIRKAPLDIGKLIDEARDMGCNIHDYVALRLYGHVSDTTHEAAKNIAFVHLYGGHTSKAEKANKAASTNFAVQCAEMSEWAKKLFATTYAPPQVQGTSFAVQFSATRKRMLDTFAKYSTPPTYKQYTIRVKGDEDYSAMCFSVPALSAQAARVLAFALYGGFGSFKEAEPVLQDDDIELALAWTEVID